MTDSEDELPQRILEVKFPQYNPQLDPEGTIYIGWSDEERYLYEGHVPCSLRVWLELVRHYVLQQRPGRILISGAVHAEAITKNLIEQGWPATFVENRNMNEVSREIERMLLGDLVRNHRLFSNLIDGMEFWSPVRIAMARLIDENTVLMDQLEKEIDQS